MSRPGGEPMRSTGRTGTSTTTTEPGRGAGWWGHPIIEQVRRERGGGGPPNRPPLRPRAAGVEQHPQWIKSPPYRTQGEKESIILGMLVCHFSEGCREGIYPPAA